MEGAPDMAVFFTGEVSLMVLLETFSVGHTLAGGSKYRLMTHIKSLEPTGDSVLGCGWQVDVRSSWRQPGAVQSKQTGLVVTFGVSEQSPIVLG